MLSRHSLYRNLLILVQLQIPASFSIELKRDDSDLTLNHNRRLLNTEKLIFKTETLDSLSNQVLLLYSTCACFFSCYKIVKCLDFCSGSFLCVGDCGT